MFSAVLRPHDNKYLKYLHTYVLPPPDNEPKVLSLSTTFPQFWGNLHFLPTECRKDLKRIRRRSEIVVISLNNPMTQEWIDLALTSASKSVPIWNVNIGLCFRMFKASSCKIHAWKMRIRSDGRCVSTVMDPFRMDWASLWDRVPPNHGVFFIQLRAWRMHSEDSDVCESSDLMASRPLP